MGGIRLSGEIRLRIAPDDFTAQQREPLPKNESSSLYRLGERRCISFSGSRSGSQLVMRYELRDVAIEPSGPGDFQPDIPAGMRVVDEPGYPPEPVNPAGLIARQAVKEARSAVNSFLGVIRGENTR
jgi:hypothetical protein